MLHTPTIIKFLEIVRDSLGYLVSFDTLHTVVHEQNLLLLTSYCGLGFIKVLVLARETNGVNWVPHFVALITGMRSIIMPNII